MSEKLPRNNEMAYGPMKESLLKYVPRLDSAGPWLSGMGAVYASIIGLVFAGFLIGVDCIPVPPTDPKATTIPTWQVIYLIGFPLLFVLAWLILTQSYLRSGQGTKIGLAYDGHNVNVADWKRTHKTLSELLRNKHIKNRVTLRFVPPRSVLTDDYANKYMKGYDFAILITVRQSPPIHRKSFTDSIPVPTYKIEIVTKEAEKRFLQTILPHSFSITRKVEDNLSDLLNKQAYNLHDILLLFVAAHCYLDKQYKDAAAISRHLEQSLCSIMGPFDEPRRQTRLLDANSRLSPTIFSVKELLSYDKLVDIRDFAETAICYFDDFPLVAIAISRMRFLTGDIESSIELTKRVKNKIDQIRSVGEEPIDRVLAVYFLNSAFLSFIQGHWVNAYNGYRNMLSVDAYRNENWPEIINFIDYVADLEAYDGVSYLQTLYRLIAKRPVQPELRTSADDWLNQDESHKELKTLLSCDYPALNSRMEARSARANGQPHKKRGKVKQRSKRKPKDRKKNKRR